MTEHEIRRALHGLAEAPGHPDETAAWSQIRAGIERDGRRQRRRKALGLVGLAAAASAAAGLLIVAGGGGDREAVEIGPADGTTAPSVARTGVAPALDGFPDQPVAVVVLVGGAQQVDLYDGETGELVTSTLARSVHSISDVSVARNGFVYFTEEVGDGSLVRAVPWDGSTEPFTPYGAHDTDSSSPTLSSDGRIFAYLHQGITVAQPSIQVVDVASGDRLSVVVAGPEVRLSNLEFSPGGSGLLVAVDGVASYVALPAPSAAEALPLATSAGEAHWSAGDEILVLTLCCGTADEPADLASFTLDGPGAFAPEVPPGAVAFDAGPNGRLAVVVGDESVVLSGGGVPDRVLDLAGVPVDVGI